MTLAPPPLPQLPQSDFAQPHLAPRPGNADDADNLRKFAAQVLRANGNDLANSNRFIWRTYYWAFVMYVTLFAVGVVTAICAIIKGFTATTGGEVLPSLVFAGLSAGSFFTLFISRPLESLERNSVYSSWLIAAMNTYWTRLMYLSDLKTIDVDLKNVTADLIAELSALGTAYATAYAAYPPLAAAGSGSGSGSDSGSPATGSPAKSQSEGQASAAVAAIIANGASTHDASAGAIAHSSEAENRTGETMNITPDNPSGSSTGDTSQN